MLLLLLLLRIRHEKSGFLRTKLFSRCRRAFPRVARRCVAIYRPRFSPSREDQRYNTHTHTYSRDLIMAALSCIYIHPRTILSLPRLDLSMHRNGSSSNVVLFLSAAVYFWPARARGSICTRYQFNAFTGSLYNPPRRDALSLSLARVCIYIYTPSPLYI